MTKKITPQQAEWEQEPPTSEQMRQLVLIAQRHPQGKTFLLPSSRWDAHKQLRTRRADLHFAFKRSQGHRRAIIE
jgi:hypothetical protein